MARTKLNMKKEILGIGKKWWFRQGVFIKKDIREDMNDGITQGGVSRYSTKGGKYAYSKYKARGMKGYRGKKLEGFPGTSLNRQTGSVNMMLTGRTISRLKPVKATKKSVTMSYSPKDKDAIVGNIDYDPKRDIATLNEGNQIRMRKRLSKEYDRRIKKWKRKTITIKI